ncbi:MAG: phosphoribosyl-AMP cyclohydrolase [Gammaproteobacteria bacterium]|jgi:phosphoribosyl-AMP cyclohydrolase
MSDWLSDIKWNEDGLLPAIAQDASTGEVLMMAWMNEGSLQLSVEKGEAVYWSRSRRKLWHKGEESGHTQIIEDIRLDCDSDVILLKIRQNGGIACHTGRRRCFYRVLNDKKWEIDEEIIKNPREIYQ